MLHIPLISRIAFRRNWHPSCNWAGGLPGFIGPFPSTSLDESFKDRLYCTLDISLFKFLASMKDIIAL